MKKYLSQIFTTYIILLSLIPCSGICSIDISSVDDKVCIEVSHENEHDNNCTPMCVCSCCNNILPSTDQFVFKHFKVYSKINQTDHFQFPNQHIESTSPPPKS